MKIVLDNSQNFGIISHILKHEEPSGLALVIYRWLKIVADLLFRDSVRGAWGFKVESGLTKATGNYLAHTNAPPINYGIGRK